MKTLLSFGLVVAFVLFVAVSILPARAAGAVRERAKKSPAHDKFGDMDVEAILWAIRQRESGDNPWVSGRHGERTAYQFTAATWRHYTDYPFGMAAGSRERADRVARVHLAAVVHALRRRHLEVEPEFIGAAWRFGAAFLLEAVRTEYARSIAALYEDRRARK